MIIIVLNSGSSSVKYRLFEMEGEVCLAWGSVERIGARGSILSHQRHDGNKVKLAGEILDHQSAIEYIMAILLSPNHGVIQDRAEIKAVGHRVVHGGEKFTGSALIDGEVMEQLHECVELAPLHNPANIKGIQACKALMPAIPQVAVFDTAFHHKMPDYAYLYGLPYILYKKYSVRRFGFHGTSHRYVADRAASLMGKPLTELKLVTCHLGNGCSSAAVDRGVSVDTTMGFTPVEGLLMGTRTGDLDAAALLYVMSREEIGVGDANSLINKHSGLQGISGVSNDMREIETEASGGNSRARLAHDVFCYRVRKYIGAYAAAMGGLDGVVFTGGIGENSSLVRQKSVAGLGFLGIELNDGLNSTPSKEERFIDAGSRVRVMVIPTNEELVIARDTLELVG
jgi:acetate kinase